METSVKSRKQRNKRRERAQRMQAEREKDADGVGADVIADGDDSDDDSRKKSPIRPPQRRKKVAASAIAVVAVCNNNSKHDNNNCTQFKEPSPILEEDVVDGFAILSFKTYEDLEVRSGWKAKKKQKLCVCVQERFFCVVPFARRPEREQQDTKTKISTTGRDMRVRAMKSNRLLKIQCRWA